MRTTSNVAKVTPVACEVDTTLTRGPRAIAVVHQSVCLVFEASSPSQVTSWRATPLVKPTKASTSVCRIVEHAAHDAAAAQHRERVLVSHGLNRVA